MSESVLTIENVNRLYDDGERQVEALKDINLELKRGEFVSIIGASGCGKTTLLRLIAGLDKINTGSIVFNGEPVKEPNYKRGYIFQQHNLFPWLTVEQNVAAGLKARHVFKKNKDKIQKYIDLVGVTGFEKSYPHQLSGGMSQRVAIARALINEPELLVLDEPMGALDSFTRADIQDKLLEIRAEKNLTMLLVTHDVDEAIYMSDRIVIMTPRPGKISEIIDVNIPHPRNRGGAEFLALRRSLLDRFDLANAHPEPEYMI
ncbi:ABC transporter ATP-binding protein [Butyrivibrio sp. XB500-5]|uniref:ABC transporter ATP-binding protein n=1 Tax=Butyrivibrio sp. XB500-5 TaxID=2364880 RepID=UPI000EA9A0C2|nr:ABC transporter ATP-binding protein [Butyrivibrio sp. XB500-5]RKM60711.1 ABC transporter ATP-binding protein [Butyrivibrio sp. XB500-5]